MDFSLSVNLNRGPWHVHTNFNNLQMLNVVSLLTRKWSHFTITSLSRFLATEAVQTLRLIKSGWVCRSSSDLITGISFMDTEISVHLSMQSKPVDATPS
jgi:hypothetical protein